MTSVFLPATHATSAKSYQALRRQLPLLAEVSKLVNLYYLHYAWK